jgi:fatty-acyl-CoA synthase/long-chain acyl-CoA synthetase
MIISGGMNVYSTEVEGVIEEHESVAQCAVIGIPHDEWGEAVHAVVVPYEESVSEAAIRSFCRDRLADYKRPKSIEFVDTLPETPYGKIDKKALREPYWQEAPREIH